MIDGDFGYELLSTYSLLRMLHHALGEGGCCKSNPTRLDLKFFLCYGNPIMYNSPSIIEGEINRAINMGLLKLEHGIVSLTEKARDLIEEHKIVDGVNENFHEQKRQMEKGNLNVARELKNRVDREGFWWYPEEWRKSARDGFATAKEKKPTAVKASPTEIEVVKRPRMPKKVG